MGEVDGGLGGVHLEGDALLDVEVDAVPSGISVADREVLTDGENVVAATLREHDRPLDGGGPDDRAAQQLAQVLEYRVAAVLDGLGDPRVATGAESDGIGPGDVCRAQDCDRLRHPLGVVAVVVPDGDGLVGRGGDDPGDAGRRVPVEDQVVLGKGGRPPGVDDGLEIGVVAAALYGVELFTGEGEGRPQFDQCQHPATDRLDGDEGRAVDRLDSTRGDCGVVPAERAGEVDQPASGQDELERACGLLVD